MVRKKKNTSLVIALAVPVVLIAAVAAAIYIPSLGFEPTYDFVYSMNNWGAARVPVVREGTVILEDPYPPTRFPEEEELRDPVLYRYDVDAGTSTEISLEEAQALTLDPSQISPDGYEVTRGGGNGGIFEVFGGFNDYNNWYIRGKNVGRRINLATNRDYYDVRFVGWILP